MAPDGRVVRPRGSVTLLSVRGVPVFVHWSFPAGGLVISWFVGFGEETVWFCLAFVLLIAIHELGHALAAAALRLEVLAVEISGAGGLCWTHNPRHPRDVFILYSAGLMAQALLLVLTVAHVGLFGPPESVVGHCFLLTFTTVNAIVFAINLLPGVMSNGLPNDGHVLWKLYLHVNKGHPHPLIPELETRLFAPETSLLDIDELVPDGFSAGVEVLNDETTPMEFVVEALEKHLALPHDDAVELMLEIHAKGGALVPLATYEQAEAVARGITSDARERSHVLVCRPVDADTRARGGAEA